MNKFKNGVVDIVKRTHLSSLLKGVMKNRIEVQLWQNIKMCRYKSHSTILDVDLINGIITVEAKKGHDYSLFDKSDVYFYSPLKSMIFKCRIKSVSTKIIKLSFPELAKIEEARSESRAVYGYRSYQFANLSLVSPRDSRKIKIDYAKVMDSSDDGMGLLISPKDAQYFKVGGKLISTESSIGAMKGRAGVIRSMSKDKNELTGEIMLRVGVELLTM